VADKSFSLGIKVQALVSGLEEVRALAKELAALVRSATGPKPTLGNELGSDAEKNSTGVRKVGKAVTDLNSELKKTGAEGKKAVEGLDSPFEKAGGAVGKLLTAVKFLGGGFLALQGVGLLKDVVDTAAKTETLGVVLLQTGKNAGYTAAQLDDADKTVQKLGITAAASRQSLAQLIQAGIKLDFAPQLARAAQDLAVVSGQNSSDTLQRLITNISQLDTMGLRFMGIMVDQQKIFADAAKDAGVQISETYKKQILANAVLTEASKLTGIYEASLGTAGKQLSSMPRYIEEMKVALGEQLLPVYFELVKGANEILKSLGELSREFNSSGKSAKSFVSDLEGGQELSSFAGNIRGAVASIKEFIGFLKENKEAIKQFVLVLRDVAVGLGIAGAVAGAMVALTALINGATLLVGILGGVVAWLTSTAAAATVAGAALAFVAGPVGLVIAGVVALVAALTAGYFAFKKLTSGQKEAATSSVDAARSIQEWKVALDREQEIISRLVANRKELGRLSAVEIGQVTRGDTSGLEATKAQMTSLRVELTKLDKELKAVGEAKQAAFEKIKSADLSAAEETEVKAILKANADKAKSIKDAQAAMDAFRESLKNAGIDESAFITGVETKYRQVVDGIVSGARSIEEAAKTIGGQTKEQATQAAIGIDALLLKLAELASQTKTKEELAQLQAALRGIAEAAQAAGTSVPSKAITGIEATAKASVKRTQDEIRAGGQKALDEGRRITVARAALLTEQARSELAITKANSDAQLSAAEFQYGQGLVSLEDYYERRRSALRENQAKERAADQAQLRELQTRQRVASAESPSAGIEAGNAVIAQQNKIRESRIRQEKEVADLVQKYAKDRIDLEKGITDQVLRNKAIRRPGDESVQIELINQKYREQEKALGGDTRALAANTEARDLEIAKLKEVNTARLRDQEIRNRLLQSASDEGAQVDQVTARYADQIRAMAGNEAQIKLLIVARDLEIANLRELGAEKRRQQALELAEARQNVVLADVALREAQGELSVAEAERRRLDVKREKLRLIQAEAAALEELIVKKVLEGKVEADVTSDRVRLENLRAQIKGIKTELEQTQGWDDLTNAFDRMFNDILTGAKSFKDALRDFFKNTASDIARDMSKDLSKELVAGLKKILSSETNGEGGVGSILMAGIKKLFGFGKQAPTDGGQVGAPITAPGETGTEAAGVLSTQRDTWDQMVALADESLGSIQRGISSFFTSFTESASAGWTSFLSGASDLWSQLSSGVGNMADTAVTYFSSAASSLGDVMSSMAEGVANVVSNIVAAIAQMIAAQQAEAASSAVALAFAQGGLVPAKPRRFATGGPVWGAGTATSDSIPAWLSNGEFVLKAKAVKALGVSFLNGLNSVTRAPGVETGRQLLGALRPWQRAETPRFADGGFVGPSEPAPVVPGANRTELNIRNVLVTDHTLVTDVLSSSQGEKTLMTFITKNRASIKQAIGA
jgi:hypothetical protein